MEQISRSAIPLTSFDLREIAKTLDSVVRALGEHDNLTKFGKQFFDVQLDVLRPDSEDVIGSISYYDGWLGFFPRELS